VHFEVKVVHQLTFVLVPRQAVTDGTVVLRRSVCFGLFTVQRYAITGCLQLLEIWNLIGPLGNVEDRPNWFPVIKTGYQIAYLRNWSPYFIFATATCCIKRMSYFCSISRQTTSVHYVGGRSKADVLDFSYNPSWNLLEICLIKFVDAPNK